MQYASLILGGWMPLSVRENKWRRSRAQVKLCQADSIKKY